ncbi:hypothetical protein [Microbacterium aurantiacum]|uniref:hypothetical protein n=1 Tax=Microbacterium aurantiacum TaxID=162393 RepID=UPI0034406864
MSEPDLAHAWILTRALSPRDSVRVAVQSASGEALNEYPSEIPTTSPAPTVPWAMYLSADRQRYDFVVFDLDASQGNAPYDAGRLSLWLDELNIDHLMCESGPSGGRHVWIGLADSVDADTVRTVAVLAKQLLPSLDSSPLTNPVTGAVRPPGAPHRRGGASTPLGPLSSLTRTSVPSEAMTTLSDFLVDLGAEISPATTAAAVRGMAVDDDGHPYIAGPRRELSPRVAAIVDAPPAADASLSLASVLAGCAHARWRYDDVLSLIHSPAFEHVRTRRASGATRVARTADARLRVLAHAWQRAVVYVATNPLNGAGDDVDYAQRAHAVVRAVERAQAKADAMPGLWAPRRGVSSRTTRGSFSVRAVLDAVCLYMLRSARTVVEADVRRLSADTGYGRTTVHTALQLLTTPRTDTDPDSAWLVRVEEAEGPHGARYRLSKRFSTESHEDNRTQVLARPAAGPPTLQALAHALETALAPLAHDTFAAPRSLGRAAGIIYRHLSPDAVVSLSTIARRTALDPARLRALLERLHSHRLIVRSGEGWMRSAATQLDRASALLDVDGYLERRRSRYDEERARWAWWSAELQWMRKRDKKRRGRRSAGSVALFQQNDRPDFVRYPRGPDGRGDHREAIRLVEAGALSPSVALVA